MKPNDSNERLMRILQASPEQLAAIDRVLNGTAATQAPTTSGPLLMMVTDAAKLLGVSRATIWRLTKVGKLMPVEILPGTFRIRRTDIEKLAEGMGV